MRRPASLALPEQGSATYVPPRPADLALPDQVNAGVSSLPDGLFLLRRLLPNEELLLSGLARPGLACLR